MLRNSYLLPILLILFPAAASAQEVRGKVSVIVLWTDYGFRDLDR